MKRALPWLIAGLLGFAYGYVSHWKHLFPYQFHGPLGEFVQMRLLGRDAFSSRVAVEGPDAEAIRAKSEELMALGYASGYSPRTAVAGVATHAAAKVADGLNLVVSADRPGAYLMDASGTVLHRWQKTFREAFPDVTLSANRLALSAFWKRVHLFENGELLALFEGGGLIKLAPDSRLLWARNLTAHHDLDVDPEGRIYVLTKQARLIPRINESEPVLEDFVTILDAQGLPQKQLSVLEALERSPYASLLQLGRTAGDIFHTNTLTVIRRDDPRLPAIRRGRLLLCFRHLNTVAVLDPDSGRIEWAMTGLWSWPHEPVLLDDGGLLIFDNRGAGDRRSRILEVDPVTQQVLWSFLGETPFHSAVAGVVQRLPNGNTLVTVSTEGRAFEVTRAGEVVWEFVSPHEVASDLYSRSRIATLFELVRLPPGRPAWLDGGRVLSSTP